LIPSDTKDPGAELSAMFVAGQTFDHSHEDLLRRVLGIGSVPQLAKEEAKDGIIPGRKQTMRGETISSLSGGNDCGIWLGVDR
jgi:hypothetical protein